MRLIDADALIRKAYRADVHWIGYIQQVVGTAGTEKGKTMRLIDADALIDELGISDEDIIFEGMLEDAPTIDAVPVVRCKDCKYRDPEDKKCDCGHAILWQLPRDDDWFCADGERRDDETDRR